MSATPQTRIPLAEAKQVAINLSVLLEDACERCLIVGSVRRQAPTAHDVELLVVPRYVTTVRPDGGLFGSEVATTESALDRICADLLHEGLFTLPEHRAWGPRLKRLVYEGVTCELFIALAPSQWGLASVVRTGPADFSHQLVTPRTQTIVDSQRGKRTGLMPADLRVHDFGIYRGTVLIPTETEEDVFAVIGRPYVPPEERR